MESTTTLFGRVGAAICWYFDGEFETPRHDYRLAARLVKRLPWVLRGEFDVLDDFELFALLGRGRQLAAAGRGDGSAIPGIRGRAREAGAALVEGKVI
jgi:hypothetical protein